MRQAYESGHVHQQPAHQQRCVDLGAAADGRPGVASLQHLETLLPRAELHCARRRSNNRLFY